ncbi:MAG: hypothetical protein HS115_17605 [Spirochaetales bacterium]|nr:hypothetical protein [Spirochaetales bacterium]
MQIVLQGILKKNSRGTAYLVYFNPARQRQIVRLQADPENIHQPHSGQTVSVVGQLQGKYLKASKIVPCFFPVYRK